MAIKAKLKPRTGCEIVLECEMGRGELEAAYERTYKRLSRHVEIAGFRRGHAPRELVEQRFGRVIQDQTLEDVILEVIRRVVKQYNLEMVGGVRGLDEVVYPEEGPLRFALEFEVRPKVKLQSYTGIPLKKRKVEVREQDVESIIKELLEREATYEPPVEARAAGYGDWLVVDYTGKVDGETVVKREEAWV
ncbi:MAG: trigger factor, partial [bacterium]|nr:trigger factor [bacterium]